SHEPLHPSTRSSATRVYALSLHDALPICSRKSPGFMPGILISTTTTSSVSISTPGSLREDEEHKDASKAAVTTGTVYALARISRSGEHTSELQSRRELVCRLLLEKKKQLTTQRHRRPCGSAPYTVRRRTAASGRSAPAHSHTACGGRTRAIASI